MLGLESDLMCAAALYSVPLFKTTIVYTVDVPNIVNNKIGTKIKITNRAAFILCLHTNREYVIKDTIFATPFPDDSVVRTC